MCPRGARLLAGQGGLLAEARLVAPCLLIESGDGLVLVDTGFGTGDAADPGRLGAPFRALVSPQCEMAETAVRQIEGMGLDPADVRHIVITHLDLDHAGGLGDFPDAEGHVFARELERAGSPSMREKPHYLEKQWAHGPKWVEHDVDGDSWLGFDSVRLLPGLDPEIALVPLGGHTRGHSGVALRDGDGWLLHCGDAYFHRGEVQTPPSCPPVLKAFQELTSFDGKQRKANQARLRELVRAHGGNGLRTICAHDHVELERERG